MRCYKRFCFTKLNCTRSPQPHQYLNGFFVTVFIVAVSFLLIPFTIICSELVWKLAEEISLQSASKRFPSFGPPANGTKSNAKKSRFRPNQNLTGTIYHWSVILRSFSVVLNSRSQGRCKQIFQGSLTLLASFVFTTSCPKIKVWCMRSNGILFL